MQNADTLKLSRHARERAQQRSIPTGVISLILEYGTARNAGEGAVSYSFTKKNLRAMKRLLGRSVTDALCSYRDAYVVVADGLVITAAIAKQRTYH